jgi:hypothetical protein
MGNSKIMEEEKYMITIEMDNMPDEDRFWGHTLVRSSSVNDIYHLRM